MQEIPRFRSFSGHAEKPRPILKSRKSLIVGAAFPWAEDELRDACLDIGIDVNKFPGLGMGAFQEYINWIATYYRDDRVTLSNIVFGNRELAIDMNFAIIFVEGYFYG